MWSRLFPLRAGETASNPIPWSIGSSAPVDDLTKRAKLLRATARDQGCEYVLSAGLICDDHHTFTQCGKTVHWLTGLPDVRLDNNIDAITVAVTPGRKELLISSFPANSSRIGLGPHPAVCVICLKNPSKKTNMARAPESTTPASLRSGRICEVVKHGLLQLFAELCIQVLPGPGATQGPCKAVKNSQHGTGTGLGNCLPGFFPAKCRFFGQLRRTIGPEKFPEKCCSNITGIAGGTAWQAGHGLLLCRPYSHEAVPD